MTAPHAPAHGPGSVPSTSVAHARQRLIFISAAEPSADQHAADLIRTARAADPTLRFIGIAGPKMVAAGCTSIYDMTRHAAMLLSALGNVSRGISALSAADQCFRRFGFAAAVLLDSPVLHLPLAAKARAAGIPVLYYIAPQLWAWGANRIYKVRHRVDRLAVILPFEEKFFRDQGVDARFVGHPLAERLAKNVIDEDVVADLRRKGDPVVALLPGSRRHVIESVLPGQIEVAEGIAARFPRAAFVVSAADPRAAATIRPMIARSSAPLHLFEARYDELLRAADLVLVASGTAALEVAFHQKPMIVMYNASPVFYHLIGRWMLRTPFLSLPNILAQREIVPEFMPYYRSAAPIIRTAIELLESRDRREMMIRDLQTAVAPLQAHCASREVTAMLSSLVNQH